MSDTHEDIPQGDTAAETPAAETGAPETPGYDDLDTPMIALVGVLSAIITFICVIGLQAIYLQYQSDIQAYRYEPGSPSSTSSATTFEFRELREAQEAKLNSGYSVVDAEKELIGMPIDQAMKVVVEGYQAK